MVVTKLSIRCLRKLVMSANRSLPALLGHKSASKRKVIISLLNQAAIWLMGALVNGVLVPGTLGGFDLLASDCKNNK